MPRALAAARRTRAVPAAHDGGGVEDDTPRPRRDLVGAPRWPPGPLRSDGGAGSVGRGGQGKSGPGNLTANGM